MIANIRPYNGEGCRSLRVWRLGIREVRIEPHPTHPEMELHTYRCVDCGPVKTSLRLRPGRLPRAA